MTLLYQRSGQQTMNLAALSMCSTPEKAKTMIMRCVSAAAWKFRFWIIYQITDESERMARINQYLTDLGTYVGQMEANHAKLHEGSANANVRYPYNKQNCILGATDILLDTMMLSLPAPQVLAGCGSNADTLNESMHAMEEMMYLVLSA